MAASLLGTGLTHAQDVYEGFDYTPGVSLNSTNDQFHEYFSSGANGGTGWDSGWGGGEGESGGRTIIANSIAVADLASTGNRTRLIGSRIFRNFATPAGEGTHYIQVALQHTDGTGEFGLTLVDPERVLTELDRGQLMLIGKDDGYGTWTVDGVSTGETDGMGQEITVADSGVSASVAALLVVKLELQEPSAENPEGLERVTFWVNPDLSRPERLENAVGARSYTTTADFGSVSMVGIVAADNVSGDVDEIRVSSNSLFVAGPEIVLEEPASNVLGDDEETDFGGLPLGQSVVRTFTVRNNGTAALTDLAAVIQDAGTPFSVGALSSTSVAPGESATFTVTYAPVREGVASTSLAVTSNDPYRGSIMVDLRGIGIFGLTGEDEAQNPVADGSQKDFGPVFLGDTASATYLVRNSGGVALTDLTVAVGSSSAYSVGPLSASSLEPGGTATFTVTYSPVSKGEDLDAVVVSSGGTYQGTFALALKGLASVVELGVETPEGDLLANGDSLVRLRPGIGHELVLKNYGNATLTDLAVSVTGDVDGNFSVSGLSVTEIAAGGSTTVTLLYDAADLTVRNATLSITSSDRDDNPYLVGLTGPLFEKFITLPAPGAGLESGTINWEEAAIGLYDGLLYDGESKLAGALESFKIAKPKKGAAGGAVTGRLRVGGRKITVKGAFDASGLLVASLPQKKGEPPVELNLQLYRTEGEGGGEVVSGTVVWGDLEAEAELLRAPFSNKNKAPEDWTGKFTLLMPVNEDRAVNEPGGDGWATVNITPAGGVRVTGALGDGTRWTESGYLSADGEFVLYNELYRSNPKGVAGGKMTFRDVASVSDFDGPFQWVKLADDREKSYGGGFSVTGQVIGSRFVAPAKGAYVLPVLAGDPQATLTLLWDPILAADPEQVQRVVLWNDKHRWTFSGADKLSGNASKSTGAFNGSYRAEGSRTTLKLKGVVFQKQNLVGGHFLIPGGTGLVRMHPGTNVDP